MVSVVDSGLRLYGLGGLHPLMALLSATTDVIVDLLLRMYLLSIHEYVYERPGSIRRSRNIIYQQHLGRIKVYKEKTTGSSVEQRESKCNQCRIFDSYSKDSVS